MMPQNIAWTDDLEKAADTAWQDMRTEPHPHQYVEGHCSVCGQPEPQYPSDATPQEGSSEQIP